MKKERMARLLAGRNFLPLVALVLASALFCSCQSLQQEVPIQDAEEEGDSFSAQMQRALAKEDASYFLGQSADTSACLNVASQIQKQLAAEGLSKNRQARLLALQGRALFLAGQTDGTKKCLSEAQKKYPFDEEVAVLENRLFPQNESGAKNSSSALMLLEDALNLFKGQNYSQAAARFDTAFLRLDNFYKEAYNPIRQKAWALKGIALPATKEGQAIAAASQITVGDILVLCSAESGLLDYCAGGKKLSSSKLYSIVAAQGLLTSVSGTAQDNAASVPSEKQSLSKETLARFLWNVKNRSLSDKSSALKYSVRYRANVKAKSPAADVSVWSKDFDAILGCVEKEWMSFPDGKNFFPQKIVSGMEAFEILTKAK